MALSKFITVFHILLLVITCYGFEQVQNSVHFLFRFDLLLFYASPEVVLTYCHFKQFENDLPHGFIQVFSVNIESFCLQIVFDLLLFQQGLEPCVDLL